MKRKIVQRNKQFLTRLLRLARRGKLCPDWRRVELLNDRFFLPFVGPSGKIFYYKMLEAFDCLVERSLQDIREGLVIDADELLAQRRMRVFSQDDYD